MTGAGVSISEADLARVQDTVAILSHMVTSEGALHAAILRHVPRLFCAEISAVNFADLGAGRVRAVARSRAGPVPDTDGPVSRLIDQHPILMHFKTAGDTGPHRISEFRDHRSWMSCALYSEVFRPMGTPHQLVLPLVGSSPGAGTGLSFNRSGLDFTDTDCHVAAVVKVGLTALCRAARAVTRAQNGPEPAVLAEQFGLTQRETEVVVLLIQGATATAIGHALRISPRTVRKHLEHVYDKTDRHDRLAIAQLFTSPPLPLAKDTDVAAARAAPDAAVT